ncbi:MAG: nucleotide sugar dehydrogenase [Myxococcota bacterium]
MCGIVRGGVIITGIGPPTSLFSTQAGAVRPIRSGNLVSTSPFPLWDGTAMTPSNDSWLAKTASASSTVSGDPRDVGNVAIVGGCGHVGLPLGMAFANKGFQVDLLDLSVERVNSVNEGRMPFKERGADELLPQLLRASKLKATTDAGVLKRAGVVIVTIGTPVGDFLDPQVNPFNRAMRQLIPQLAPNALLILRSTVVPGVTAMTQRTLEEMGRGDVDLSFCPERIVQEYSLEELEKLPQIISATNPRAAERAAELFRALGPKIIFLKPVEAELAKLFCNCFRYIQFAASNQFLLISQHYGADFHRIYHAVREDYPRMAAFARPGLAAGPCLVKDTAQLGGFNKVNYILGNAAMMVNEGMPAEMVEMAKRRGYKLTEMTVGVLGMGFKINNDDPRDSLSYKLKKVLQLEAKKVICTDPWVPDPNLRPLDEVLEQSDIIFVGTPHDCYRSIKFKQPVIDITGILSNDK